MWGLGVDLLGVGFVGFAVTGPLLFWSLKRDRRLGLAVLAASSLYMLASLAWLELAR